jgi:hypothetical protein
MIGAARAHRRLGGSGPLAIVHRRSLPMPHPLPAFAALLAAPLLGLAVHAALAHTTGAPAPAPAAATLPNNLCASCHGGGRVVSNQSAGALDAGDLVAARSYLGDVTRG